MIHDIKRILLQLVLIVMYKLIMKLNILKVINIPV